jgi:hypothetical protein
MSSDRCRGSLADAIGNIIVVSNIEHIDATISNDCIKVDSVSFVVHRKFDTTHLALPRHWKQYSNTYRDLPSGDTKNWRVSSIESHEFNKCSNIIDHLGRIGRFKSR